jgi:hypothetical protein
MQEKGIFGFGVHAGGTVLRGKVQPLHFAICHLTT